MPKKPHWGWHSVRFQSRVFFKARLYPCQIQEMLHLRNWCLCRWNSSTVTSWWNGSDAPRPLSERWHFVEQYFIPHYLLMFNPSSLPFLSVMILFCFHPSPQSPKYLSPFFTWILFFFYPIQHVILLHVSTFRSLKCGMCAHTPKDPILWLVRAAPLRVSDSP